MKEVLFNGLGKMYVEGGGKPRSLCQQYCIKNLFAEKYTYNDLSYASVYQMHLGNNSIRPDFFIVKCFCY